MTKRRNPRTAAGASENVRLGGEDRQHPTSKPAKTQAAGGAIPADQFRRAAEILPESASHYRPILLAAADFGIAFGQLMQGCSGKAPLPPPERGCVYVVGDDTDHAEGPNGFRKAGVRRIIRKATHIAVHSGAAIPEIYATAALAASVGGFAVIIETQEDRQIEWLQLALDVAPAASILDAAPVRGRA